MQTLRRLYLYAVSLVSLETVIWGVIGLARSFLEGEPLAGNVSQLAGALAFIFVSVPVFGVHWWLAQSHALKHPEERFARLRAIFLYGALLALFIPVTQNALALFARSLANLLGADPGRVILGGRQTVSDNLVAMGINALAAVYLLFVLRADWGDQPLGDDYAETRRLFRYIWLLYGLGLVVFGAQQILQYGLEIWDAPFKTTRTQLANGLALSLVGAPVWLGFRQVIRRSLRAPSEKHSQLRLVVLYGLMLASVVSVLTGAGLILDAAFLLALGERQGWRAFLAQISTPVSLALPFGAIWWLYRGQLRAAIRGKRSRLKCRCARRDCSGYTVIFWLRSVWELLLLA